jgi:hypothetical protein
MSLSLPFGERAPESSAANNEGAADPRMSACAQLVRLSLLEATRPALLVRFLSPYADDLAKRGLAVETIGVEADAVGRLHAVLNAVDRALPTALQQALVDIADLATDQAHEHVLAIARSQQLGLFAVNARTTPEDLAFEVYLDHIELFRSAHARTQSSEVRRFVEFVGRDDRALTGATTTAKRAQLGCLVSAYFRDRNRTGYCELRVGETDSEVTLVVIHGRPPRNHGAIESDDSRTRVAYIPDKHDTIVFDRATRRLAVNAQYAREQEFYRTVVGRVFFDDDDRFTSTPVYTGEPLVLEGNAALGTHGVPGLREVILREVKLDARDENGLAVTLKAHDLKPLLSTETGRAIIRLGEIVAFKIALVIAGRPRPVQVELQVPNHLSFDRRVGGDVVREFLIEAGFMRVTSANDAQRGAA